MTTSKPDHYLMSLTGWIPNIYELIPGKPRFGPLTATAKGPKQELSAGNWTSVDIIKENYGSIYFYN
jgi:hypothetical protein